MKEKIYTTSCTNTQLNTWVELKKAGKLSNDDWSRMTPALRKKIQRMIK